MRNFKHRRFHSLGFTLVELLAVISIIGILLGLVVVALRGAQQESQVGKTLATIKKIDAVLLNRLQQNLNRPVPLDIPDQAFDTNQVTGRPFLPPEELNKLRTLAVRDQLRMALPDRESDVVAQPMSFIMKLEDGRVFPVPAPPPTPEIVSLRRQLGYANPDNTNLGTPLANYEDDGNGNFEVDGIGNAEILYAIVRGSTLNGEPALANFADNEIADTDDDGAPEFIDAWGNPIRFVRWPAGYNWPDIVNNGFFSVDPYSRRQFATGTTPPADIPLDPFDPNNADWGLDSANAGNNSFPLAPLGGLVPLVISAGPDGEFGLDFTLADVGVPELSTTQHPRSASRSYTEALLPENNSVGGLSSDGYNGIPYPFIDPYFPRRNYRARATNGAAELLVPRVANGEQEADNVANLDVEADYL